jgi:hypothetical protein
MVYSFQPAAMTMIAIAILTLALSSDGVCRNSPCTPLRSFYAVRMFFVAEGCCHLGFLVVLQGSGVALGSANLSDAESL